MFFFNTMCGRFSLDTTAIALAKQFAVEVGSDIPPRYNIAPSQPILVIKQDETKRRKNCDRLIKQLMFTFFSLTTLLLLGFKLKLFYHNNVENI